ncbi:MAG: hypothetical protein ABH826_02135 [Patescibacteria group bacterium]|nr:hypothetical protein [Patescibacteria group bacterium]
MPTKKKATKKPTVVKTKVKKKVVKKSEPKKKPTSMEKVMEPVVMPSICRSCNALPMGSTELVTLLLVVTFSLSAILLTSVYAMEKQSSRIDRLESEVQYYQQL